jgi:hypothetical protein
VGSGSSNVARLAGVASRHAGEAVEHETARNRDVQARALSDHWDLDAEIRGINVFLGDAMPFVAEQDHRSLPGWLQPRQRDRAFRELDGEDPPAVSALSLDPAILARIDPVNARHPFRPERVALSECCAVVDGVGDGDARADGIARSEQRSEVGLERDP